MDGFILTKHFESRLQQRSVPNTAITALLHYGERRSSRQSVYSLIFTKGALFEILIELGATMFKTCEKLRNTYIIVSEEGSLITVARSYRKAMH